MKLISRNFRFTVKISQAAGFHGQEPNTQTACKLISFTNTGMAHVISYLLFFTNLYGYYGLKLTDFSKIDKNIKTYLGWIVCLIFAVEGIFGMIPAIYMDVNIEGTRCKSSQPIRMNISEYIASYILLQSIFPYILPFCLSIWPLWCMISKYNGISDKFYRDVVKNILVINISYIIIYLPLALIDMVIFLDILG